jgi:ABC-type sugar transport system ATPase subunit
MPDPDKGAMVSGISKSFGPVVALGEVSFEVGRGGAIG